MPTDTELTSATPPSSLDPHAKDLVGESEANPIVVSGVTTRDFRAFVRCMVELK